MNNAEYDGSNGFYFGFTFLNVHFVKQKLNILAKFFKCFKNKFTNVFSKQNYFAVYEALCLAAKTDLRNSSWFFKTKSLATKLRDNIVKDTFFKIIVQREFKKLIFHNNFCKTEN